MICYVFGAELFVLVFIIAKIVLTLRPSGGGEALHFSYCLLNALLNSNIVAVGLINLETHKSYRRKSTSQNRSVSGGVFVSLVFTPNSFPVVFYSLVGRLKRNFTVAFDDANRLGY